MVPKRMGEQPVDLELWIGLVELRPLDRKTFGAAGAFTNIVTWGQSADGFRTKAELVAQIVNMFVAGVERAEPLAERKEKWTLTEEVEDIIRRAESNPDAIIFGTFHTYRHDEA
jgi:hypothetical protein